ncbi:MAG TPA: peptidase C14 [Cyanothece sp. UBA12306]|nr:peptidase C14 [Cyanothece sp. UBA12306]
MKWDRRTFLKTLLTWGVSQAGLEWFNQEPKLQKYYQTLAGPTPRKLALLVGINDYSNPFTLKGCLTDVERQKELLIYRFGLKPQDIVTLTGRQATYEGIKRAFEEHLVQQAQTGDVVLFHFSGYGNLVQLDSGDVVRGLIPHGGIVSNKGQPIANNFLEETLQLLGRSLATDKLTMVLDTSYEYLGQDLQSNLRVRSFPHVSQQVNPQELEFQSQLTEKFPATKPRGMILRAISDGQMAREITSNNLSCGLFTYALTQSLWQLTSPSKIMITLAKTTQEMVKLTGNKQEPQSQKSDKQPLFTYYLLPTSSQGTEGIITAVDDQSNATIKLTGLPIPLLEEYGLNSCFRIVTDDNSTPLIVQLRSREGLKGKVNLLEKSESSAASPLQVGQLLQETLRCLPKNVGLTVALDQNLERIERVDATSAFSSIENITSVVIAGEQGADCLLGQKNQADATDSKTKTEKYGLFWPGGITVPKTFGQSGEAIKSAVERLRQPLKKLLAAKLWWLTLNQESSQLPIAIALESLDQNQEAQIIGQRQTTRTAKKVNRQPFSDFSPISHGLIQLPRNSRLQYRWHNQGDDPIYYLLLGIDVRGEAIAYLPHPEQISILPGETLVIPSLSPGLNLTVTSTPGWEQILAISCQSPLNKTWETLTESSGFKPNQEQILTLDNPLKVAHSLLEDLHLASAINSELMETATDSYKLDLKTWATVSFVYQVI